MLNPQKIHWQVSQSQKSQKLSLRFRKVEFNSDSYLVIEHSATHGFWSTFSICFLWQVSVEDHKVHSARASQSHHNLPSSDAPMMGHNLRADIINPMAGQPTPPTPKYPTPCLGWASQWIYKWLIAAVIVVVPSRFGLFRTPSIHGPLGLVPRHWNLCRISLEKMVSYEDHPRPLASD